MYGFSSPGGKDCHEVIPPTAIVAEMRDPNVIVLGFDEDEYTPSEGEKTNVIDLDALSSENLVITIEGPNENYKLQ